MNHGFRSPGIGLALLVAAGCAGSDGSSDGTADDAPAVSSVESQDLKAAGFKYSFENWDHDGSNNDNPVSIVFVSGRSDLVSRVYDQVSSVGLTHSGSKMTLSGIGGSRSGVSSTDPWTSHSAGRKGAWGCWGSCDSNTDIHLRTYGPDGRAGTQVYQGSYGMGPYYLVATIHFDVAENTPQADFGYQDEARTLLIEKMVAAGKWRDVGSVNVQNACNARFDAHHKCEHDGQAHVVSIDG